MEAEIGEMHLKMEEEAIIVNSKRIHLWCFMPPDLW